ncbi:hypothetical protein PCANC_10314 [Puccinia coronata f. sp. avenae]|uniref:C2H2-type domain-containing protein n=1 Tax=Puccinia coronata f. sp. avenae TaxID=200324 RepID=A0A2N5UHE5_9BASI|nr:hypothetical protein PCANC_10314 [Puccinia coronata f. sp. avenae]PLW37169.1 hypothetical protein PCASD_11151 [Puccinia coronata f. sp. avenae]
MKLTPVLERPKAPAQNADIILPSFGSPNALQQQEVPGPTAGEDFLNHTETGQREQRALVLNTQEAQRPYVCLFDGCSRSAGDPARMWNFRAHIVTHMYPKRVQCTQCEPKHTYKRSNELRKHFRQTYAGVPFNKSVHQKIRTDDELIEELRDCGFQCSECLTIYSNAEEVATHFRRIHPRISWDRSMHLVIRTSDIRQEQVSEFEQYQVVAQAMEALINVMRFQQNNRRQNQPATNQNPATLQ